LCYIFFFQCISCDVEQSALVRAVLMILTILFVHVMVQVNVVSK